MIILNFAGVEKNNGFLNNFFLVFNGFYGFMFF